MRSMAGITVGFRKERGKGERVFSAQGRASGLSSGFAILAVACVRLTAARGPSIDGREALAWDWTREVRIARPNLTIEVGWGIRDRNPPLHHRTKETE